MPESYEALSVLLILLPGFVAARIVQAFTFGRSQTEVDKLIQALVYSFAIYVMFLPLHYGMHMALPAYPRLHFLSIRFLDSLNASPSVASAAKAETPAAKAPDPPKAADAAKEEKPKAAPPVRFEAFGIGDVGLLLVLAIAVGVSQTRVHTKDSVGWLLRRRGWSLVSARPTVWNDVFHDLNGWVEVQFVDGRRVLGWFNYFSDTPSEGSLFLYDASWVKEDGMEQRVDGVGLLITDNMKIEAVTFYGDGNPPASAPGQGQGWFKKLKGRIWKPTGAVNGSPSAT